MTTTSPTTPAVTAADVLRRPSAWPWWVQALAVYLATRLVAAVVLLAVARTQAANLWTPASPSYSQYTGLMWDASWYRQVAEQGYPNVLPLGADGHVQQNALAFFPLYPAAMRVVALPLRLVLDRISAATLAGVLVSLLGSLGAAVALFSLLRAEGAEGAGVRAWKSAFCRSV